MPTGSSHVILRSYDISHLTLVRNCTLTIVKKVALAATFGDNANLVAYSGMIRQLTRCVQNRGHACL